jgi:hypothetical protein
MFTSYLCITVHYGKLIKGKKGRGNKRQLGQPNLRISSKFALIVMLILHHIE